MVKKRVTLWILVPFLIVVSVIGLFFTVTDPTSWPADIMEFSPTDMRLAPSISTIWCESMSLSSSGDYVAYRVAHKPAINYKMLTKQTTNLRLKIDNGGQHVSVHELRYFLLPGSVGHILFCASQANANVFVFKSEFSMECLQEFSKKQFSEEDDSDEDSDDQYVRQGDKILKWKKIRENKGCSRNLIATSQIPTDGNSEERECNYIKSGSLTFNVTSEDVYIIAVAGENHHDPNYIRLQIHLDRTFYDYHKIKRSILMCGGSVTPPPSCNVPLTFASQERILIWVPKIQEVLSHQKLITVNAQCKPRIAFFASLTVLLPIFLFAAVSFIIKYDKKRFRDQRLNLNDSLENRITQRNESFVSPLLPESRSFINQMENIPTQCETGSDDSCPPPYDSIFDLPPPYASLKFPKDKS